VYGEHETARRVLEPAKSARDRGRADFARDRARVLHSAALRRLAGKTQVVGPGEGDVPRTRLTHSLEVAQIAREIAVALGLSPDVAETAGLAHDIGHPPFGHNGEEVLDRFARQAGGFEGNAQTLRILTRLEPKVLDAGERPVGLNLTRACLDASTKYPWPRRAGQRKYGAYPDDEGALAWLRHGAPGARRCLEAQVMDWADDVAYSVHDVEDGVHAGRIRLASLAGPRGRAEIASLAAEGFSSASPGELEAAAETLSALEFVADVTHCDYDASVSAQAALKRLTSELVGRFATAATQATRRAFDGAVADRYAELVIPPGAAAEVAVLKAVALRDVMRDPARLAAQSRQRELLAELCEALLAGPTGGMDPAFAVPDAAADGAARRRAVADQVAALTDAQALEWHHRLA
jgi:dGTPase